MFGVPLKLYWLQFCTSLTIQLKSFSTVGLSTTIFMIILLNSLLLLLLFQSLCSKTFKSLSDFNTSVFIDTFSSCKLIQIQRNHHIYACRWKKIIVLRVLTSVPIHVHSASIQSFFLPVHTSEKVNPNILCVIDDRLTTNINETNCKVLSHMRQVLWKGDS